MIDCQLPLNCSCSTTAQTIIAQWTAKVYLGADNGIQPITVNSNTYHGARDQIKAIYNVEDNDVMDLSTTGHVYGSSTTTSTGSLFLMVILAGVAVFALNVTGNLPTTELNNQTPAERQLR